LAPDWTKVKQKLNRDSEIDRDSFVEEKKLKPKILAGGAAIKRI